MRKGNSESTGGDVVQIRECLAQKSVLVVLLLSLSLALHHSIRSPLSWNPDRELVHQNAGSSRRFLSDRAVPSVFRHLALETQRAHLHTTFEHEDDATCIQLETQADKISFPYSRLECLL